eukprot:scaffold2111_cov130-Isochrysis_galbana.AAC.5
MLLSAMVEKLIAAHRAPTDCTRTDTPSERRAGVHEGASAAAGRGPGVSRRRSKAGQQPSEHRDAIINRAS